MKWILVPLMLLSAACTEQEKFSYNKAELQKLADTACLCTMRSGDEDECWAPFTSKIEGIPSMESMTSSAPFSGERICLGEDRQDCIFKGFRLVGTDQAPPVCTKEQLAEVEALHLSIWNPDEDNYQEANEAAAQLISELAERLPSTAN